MTDISKLKGIKPDEVESLRQRNVKTIEALWSRVGKGPDEINLLVEQTGIDEARLLHLLLIEGAGDSRRLGSSLLKRHWLDLILIAGIVVLILLIIRAVRLQ
jgi:hypothetical protein